MVSNNIPQVKLGIIAVSRDCFPIALSTQRRENIVKEYKGEIFNCQTTVENEKDMLKAVAEVKEQGCNALVVFLGNFGPETPETLIAKNFDGPVMFVAAAEGDGDMINGRGDAYCGMLNCSYNLGMRHLKGYIPEYPVGTAEEVAKMIADFVPVARVIIGLKGLKIITFGPRPQDFFACNAPIKGLYELGVEIEENSELDLLVAYKEHANDPRIDEVCADMAKEMGEGCYYPTMSAWPLSVSTVCKTYQVGRATARPPSQEMGDLMAIGEENCKVSDDNRVHQGRQLHLHRRVVWPVRCFLMGGSRCLSLAAHHLRHCA